MGATLGDQRTSITSITSRPSHGYVRRADEVAPRSPASTRPSKPVSQPNKLFRGRPSQDREYNWLSSNRRYALRDMAAVRVVRKGNVQPDGHADHVSFRRDLLVPPTFFDVSLPLPRLDD